MGVYNNVIYEKVCQCGKPLKDWQTKDARVEVTSKSGKKFELPEGFYSFPISDISQGKSCTACTNINCPKFMKLIEIEIENGKEISESIVTF